MTKPQVSGRSALIRSMSYDRCRRCASGSYTLSRWVMSRNRCSFNAWSNAGFNFCIHGVRKTSGAAVSPTSMSPLGSFARSRVSRNPFTRPWVRYYCGYGARTFRSYSRAFSSPLGLALHPRIIGHWTIGVLGGFPTSLCPSLSCTHIGYGSCISCSSSRSTTIEFGTKVDGFTWSIYE